MNNLTNFKNCVEIDEINSQLERADIQKRKLIRNINKEYELYLSLVRNLLYISVEKGLNDFSSYSSIKDYILNENVLFCLFENRISKLIHAKLPLITVEQLKINKIKKKIINQRINFNCFESSTKKKNNQKENLLCEDGFKYEETSQFKISEDISNTSEYYQAENDEEFVSLDLDKNDDIKYLFDNNIIENIGVEKQLNLLLVELIDEFKDEKTRHSENDNINQMDISNKYNSFKIFDLIDKSLENLLLNLSYKINQELFKANLIKKMIPKDSFEYLVSKKLMVKHPYPFVIDLEFNLNQSSGGYDLPNIIIFYLSTVELEFKNLNLSVKRNKINELKNQFQRLVKKETYWKQKEITLNKIR